MQKDCQSVKTQLVNACLSHKWETECLLFNDSEYTVINQLNILNINTDIYYDFYPRNIDNSVAR